MREKEIEKYLKKQIINLDGVCYKFVSPGNAGVPDRIIILPKNKIIFVELKTTRGRMSPLQKWQQARLIEKGARVYTLYGKKDVDKFLKFLKGVKNEICTL